MSFSFARLTSGVGKKALSCVVDRLLEERSWRWMRRAVYGRERERENTRYRIVKSLYTAAAGVFSRKKRWEKAKDDDDEAAILLCPGCKDLIFQARSLDLI